jgi:outer membrane protein assembly factor BamB
MSARLSGLPPVLLVLMLSACGSGSGMSSSTPPPPPGGGPPTPGAHTSVLTSKNDVARTGQNLSETLLTLANVNSASFGLLRKLPTDGKVDAQPLYIGGLTAQGAAHDVVFVATENDTVYAFDANSGAVLWKVSLLGSGENPSDPVGCTQVTPMIGITATPVIDPSAGAHGIMYVVAMSKDQSSNYFQRLHALDITTGAELLGGPVEVTATYPTLGGTASFDPKQYEERAALLLNQGTLFLSFTSHCDQFPYSGWLMAYDPATLTRSAVLNVAPNSNGGGPAIWMAGGGPAADSAGNVYLLTANGAFETALDARGFPNQGDFGNSFLKLTLSGGTFAVSDYFAMYNAVSESNNDQDLGSGGIMLLPDMADAGGSVQHLAVGAGKDGNLYVVSRDNMGKFVSSPPNRIYQELDNALGGGIWSTPAYFNGTIYYGPVGGSMKAFPVSKARVGSPSSSTPKGFPFPGTAPSVSANGTNNGIVWANENSNPAVLHAYDASTLAHELYNSSQAANGRDEFGAGNKFITPTVADGKVFVGVTDGVGEFALFGH